jgi:endonuclease/exonuclease/phosphatase family metal-dependent hydrolase
MSPDGKEPRDAIATTRRREPAKGALTLANWNVGGAKYLNLPPDSRLAFQRQINHEIRRLCTTWQPDLLLLQEVTRTRCAGGKTTDLVVAPPGYRYHMEPIHDSDMHSHPVRWRRYRSSANRPDDDYIGQGAGFLWREDLRHASIWDYTTSAASDWLACEMVPTETGLFTGNRDTEPRAAAVAHFVASNGNDRPTHVFVANIHLSTLHGEREQYASRDRLGAQVRLRQLQTILEGIVARHVGWSQLVDPPVNLSNVMWVVGGDFNAAPQSEEIERVRTFGFCDANPNKGFGNKTSGLGNDPTHTVDYLFANYLQSWPRMLAAFDRTVASNPAPDLSFRVSDHYPTVARLPMTTNRTMETAQ